MLGSHLRIPKAGWFVQRGGWNVFHDGMNSLHYLAGKSNFPTCLWLFPHHKWWRNFRLHLPFSWNNNINWGIKVFSKWVQVHLKCLLCARHQAHLRAFYALWKGHECSRWCCLQNKPGWGRQLGDNSGERVVVVRAERNGWVGDTLEVNLAPRT